MIESIADVAIGDFIKYSDKVGKKKFDYIGEVIALNEDTETFEILTYYGVMGFCLATIVEDEEQVTSFKKKAKVATVNNQQLEIVKTKPKGWAKFKKNPDEWVAENVDVALPPPVKAVSKKELVFGIVKNNPKMKLKGLLALAKKEVGGSDSKLEMQILLAITKFR